MIQNHADTEPCAWFCITLMHSTYVRVERVLLSLSLGSSTTRLPQQRVVRSVDGRLRADIYVGLILDGFMEYRNISAVNASIKMQYAVRPDLCTDDDDELSFNPDTDRFLTIQVSSSSGIIMLTNPQKLQ